MQLTLGKYPPQGKYALLTVKKNFGELSTVCSGFKRTTSVLDASLHNQIFSYYKYSPLPLEDGKFQPTKYGNWSTDYS